MLKFCDVSFTYGKRLILENLSFTVNDGECVCISGESGKGKSTVAKLAAGLLKPTAGSVVSPKKISYVFQEDRLLSNMNVLKNVCLNVDKSVVPFAERLLEEIGLGDWKKSRIGALSGGMKRRVAIARAICYGGDLLILDEPFNGIDYENKKILSEIILKEYIKKGKSVLLISHINEEAELLNAKSIEI